MESQPCRGKGGVLSICLPTCPSVCPVGLRICPPVCVSARLSHCLCTRLAACPYLCLSVYPCVHLSGPSTHLSVCSWSWL